jgi:hypothetical protein
MTSLVKEKKGYPEIKHCRLTPLNIYKHFHDDISTIIIGIESPTHQDRENVEFVASTTPQISKYMMIDREVQPEDLHFPKSLPFTKAGHLEQLLSNPFGESTISLQKTNI